MDIKLIEAIKRKAVDDDGLTAVDKRQITAQFGRTPAARAKVEETLKIFDDLVVDSGERQRLVTLLGLDASAQRALNVVIGTDGKELFRQREQYRDVSLAVYALKDRRADVRAIVARSLVKIGSAAVPALIATLKDRNEEIHRHRVVAKVESHSSVNRHADPDSYENAPSLPGRTLVQIGSAAVPALIVALKDSNWGVRTSAAEALGKIKDSRAVPALIAAYKDSNAWVRNAVVEALGNINDVRAQPTLIAAINDKDFDVLETVATILGYSFNHRIKRALVKAYIAAFKHRNARVRAMAVCGMSRIGSGDVPALIVALKDRDKNVRQAAAQTLRNFNTKYSGFGPSPVVIIRDPRSARRINNPNERAFLIPEVGSEAIPALIVALKDRDSDVREAVVEALNTFSDPRAKAALKAAGY